MRIKPILVAALGGAILAGVAGSSARAASTTQPTASSPIAAEASRATAHASLRLDVGRSRVWIGQAVPVTLQAYFRGAEGVTLEGAPQFTSTGIFTSDLTREPRQTTEVIGGEPVLVATWTGTLTPSTAGPLPLTAELPVRVRYRDAAPRVEIPDPFQDNPFDAFGGNPFDTSVFDRFFQQSMQQPMGRVHDEATTLRASARAIDVRPLPTANQPASFAGAIGRFELKASVSSTHARVSEPVTLRVVVQGTGDLDRVDLAGVATSDEWKAYPPKTSIETPSGGARPRRVFEQILIPLRAGERSVPAVSLTAFDPDSGQYVTRQTSPLALSVDAAAIDPDAPTASAASPAPPFADVMPQAHEADALVVPTPARPTTVALWVSPVVVLIAAAAWLSRARRKRAERALRRTMRKAAAHGELVPFYQSAHALIETRLATRWGVAPEDVSASTIRERLGKEGEPLAEALLGDEALRFGRGHAEGADLVPLCSSVERSLGGVS